MTPTEQDKELREKLAAIEHERWADWQRYVHSVCYENKGIGGEPTGELIIPSELARGWERQIGTPYQELTEKEKGSDREQVDRYWQLITAYTNKQIEAVLDRLELSMRGKTIVDTAEGWQKFVKRHVVASIEAERNKLKEQTNDQL